MDAVAAFVPDVQAPEAVVQRDRPLNDPSGVPQPTAVRDATSGEVSADAGGPARGRGDSEP